MSEIDTVNYGPLASLAGSWKGDRGKDVAPEPDGVENNPYYETLIFTLAGDVTNAESQTLATVHYRQIVCRNANDQVFHDETGYWMWDEERQIIMHSLTIPRGVSLLAGGNYLKSNDGLVHLEVKAAENDADWKILQSPFMRDNARTLSFVQSIKIENDQLSYSETTTLDIYGKTFKHTDANTLFRQ